MSRLSDLIAQAKAKDPQMGADLEREYQVLSSRLSFGLNFERHRPEAVEPGCLLRSVCSFAPRLEGDVSGGEERGPFGVADLLPEQLAGRQLGGLLKNPDVAPG